MKRYPQLAVMELDKALGEWLASSGDRGGGRRQREEEKARLLMERQMENRDNESE